MAAPSGETVVVPRNFRLLAELEKGEKADGAMNHVSYGLNDPEEDSMMCYWNGTILGPNNTAFEGRIYSLAITCDESYPEKPPVIKFRTRVNLPCVGQDGSVDQRGIGVMAHWKREHTIEDCLHGIFKVMADPSCRKLQQPPESSPEY